MWWTVHPFVLGAPRVVPYHGGPFVDTAERLRKRGTRAPYPTKRFDQDFTNSDSAHAVFVKQYEAHALGAYYPEYYRYREDMRFAAGVRAPALRPPPPHLCISPIHLGSRCGTARTSTRRSSVMKIRVGGRGPLRIMMVMFRGGRRSSGASSPCRHARRHYERRLCDGAAAVRVRHCASQELRMMHTMLGSQRLVVGHTPSIGHSQDEQFVGVMAIG